jgi:nickel transport protein
MKSYRKFQFVIILLIILCPSSVFAHNMDVFAAVEGNTIRGKANFHDGTPAKNAVVKAFDSSGEEIGRTKTDDEGKFVLEARFHCDYRLLVDTGDGHGGEYTISAKALPADLPDHGPSVASVESTHSHPAIDEPKLDKNLLAEIHADVDALQEQLNGYEHRIRFRDILGGIGFIVGLVGVGYGYYYRGLLRKNTP